MTGRVVMALAALVLVWSACGEEGTPTSAGEWKSPDELYGQLFVDVQMSGIFPDSKTFPDCVPKASPEEIVAAYEREKGRAGFDLRAFVERWFDLPRQYASDFRSDTSRSLVEHINALWPVLTRMPEDQEVGGSLIPLPYPYVVPGGRFREIYYWDSYFTMLGLQAAGKVDLIEHMVNNFAWLLDQFGHIPNGNRTYYLSRSQPPFFALMVGLLAEEKGDSIWVKYLPWLEKEYAFWMDGADSLDAQRNEYRRVVRLDDGTILNRYYDDRDLPRPEAWKEDVATAQRDPERPPHDVYRELRAAAESGWDFSSRWCRGWMHLETIRTTELIPVDLNSLLYHLEKCLARAHALAGHEARAAEYHTKAAKRAEAIRTYCWYPRRGGFFVDYDWPARTWSVVPGGAGLYPLFFKIATQEQADSVAANVFRYFLAPGGIVTTKLQTGQQWDMPNGWAPLQWIAIQGLRNYGHHELADEIKQRWIALNEKVYKATGKLVEKYNVVNLELEGGGGEYPLQDGFGWTNGVLLKLLTEPAGGE